MSDLELRYRLLNQYLAGYLHEDWESEFEDPDAAFEAVVVLYSPSELTRLLDELDHLIALDEGPRSEVLSTLSPYVDVAKDFGWEQRAWLRQLRTRAMRELAGDA